MALVSYFRFPAFMALFIQVITLGIIFIAILILPALSFNIFEWAIFQGVIALLISIRLNMAIWWKLIHLIFMPALIATLALELSPVWFFAAFILLLLIYGKTYQTQVPLYLTSQIVINNLASVLPEQDNFSFVDLGSGCGGLLNKLNKTHKHGVYYGIESAVLPFIISRLRNISLASTCKIQWGNLWQQDLSHYDFVYAYLSPVPMEELWHKACREMRPGSTFISNSFKVPDIAPERSIQLDDLTGSTLYLWRM
ncbi:MAG: hypothetical protein AAB306_06415 [Pseudomonadota bacterium]